jgi:methylmalonyl-CoA/ethylmalonyl-CoA epimerase
MSIGTQIALNSIGQIAILVKDVERATVFYRDKLGIKYLLAAGNIAFFDCGGIRLMLDKPEKPEMGTSIIYFKVDDISQAHQQMKSRGVEFVDEPHLIARLPNHDLWMTFFRDSEGNLLSIMSEVRAPKVEVETTL